MPSAPGPSLRLRVLNGLVRLRGSGRRVRFDRDALLAAAPGSLADGDYGDPAFLDGLDALLASLRETPLHPVGRVAAAQMVGSALAARRAWVRTLREHPGPAAGPRRPPLVVVGLPRTGTTFLHRLLALDPAHRAPRLWEMLPVRPPDLPDAEAEERRRSLDRLLRRQRALVPGADRRHFVRADSPEECIAMLGATLESDMFASRAPLWTYDAWLRARDRRRSYAEYRAMLGLLEASAPERRLVLKAPAHTLALRTLMGALPGALLVQTHRAPGEALASLGSLLSSMHLGMVPRPDRPRLGRAAAAHAELALAESAAARAAHPGAICDVRYPDLVADPVGAVRQIYAHHGLETSDAFERALAAYVAANPRHRHGAHRYRLADYGLSAGGVAERFQPYIDAFDL